MTMHQIVATGCALTVFWQGAAQGHWQAVQGLAYRR